MYILAFIGVVTIFQVALYRLCDKKQKPKIKWIITAILFFANLLLFPRFLFPLPKGGPKCLLPIISITLAYFIIANVIMIITATLYKFRRYFTKRKTIR